MTNANKKGYRNGKHIDVRIEMWGEPNKDGSRPHVSGDLCLNGNDVPVEVLIDLAKDQWPDDFGPVTMVDICYNPYDDDDDQAPDEANKEPGEASQAPEKSIIDMLRDIMEQIEQSEQDDDDDRSELAVVSVAQKVNLKGVSEMTIAALTKKYEDTVSVIHKAVEADLKRIPKDLSDDELATYHGRIADLHNPKYTAAWVELKQGAAEARAKAKATKSN